MSPRSPRSPKSPRLVVGVSLEGTRSAVSRERLADAARVVLRAEQVRDALVAITLVSAAHIAAINARHLKHRGPTDVISFGFPRARGGPLVADIYIAPAIARENARENGVSIREELVRLVVHGVLHALGHDHPDGEGRVRSPMWRLQESLVARVMRRTA